jgi:hypothetical protein
VKRLALVLVGALAGCASESPELFQTPWPGRTEIPETPAGQDLAPSEVAIPTRAPSVATAVEPSLPAATAPAPEVAWTSPAPGASGVASREPIQIKFTEAMDAASTEQAFVAVGFTPKALVWRDGLTLLEINAEFEYADGTSGASPIEYAWALGPGARDRYGTPLAPQTAQFSTLRRFVEVLTPDTQAGLTGCEGALEEPADTRCKDVDQIWVGDTPFSTAENQQRYRGFLTYSLASIPDDAVVEAALLTVAPARVRGDQRAMGELHVERAQFDGLDAAAFEANPGATFAVIHPEDEAVSSDTVLWAVRDDHRDTGICQFRISFPQQTDRDDEADLTLFERTAQTLEVTYVAR